MSEPTQPDPQMGLHVLITITDAQGHVVGQFIDRTMARYRTECEQCGRFYPDGYLPEFINTQVVHGFFTPAGAFVVAPDPQAIPTTDQLGGG